MKLIIAGNKIAATALDEWCGDEEWIEAPKDFNTDLIGQYRVVDGKLTMVVPDVVSRFQARAALHNAGLLSAVETLIHNEETDPIVKLAWQDATEFRRDSPTVVTMALALKLSADQIDDLFRAAAQITA